MSYIYPSVFVLKELLSDIGTSTSSPTAKVLKTSSEAGVHGSAVSDLSCRALANAARKVLEKNWQCTLQDNPKKVSINSNEFIDVITQYFLDEYERYLIRVVVLGYEGSDSVIYIHITEL